MKNIAIVTGASSGIGKTFALTLEKNIDVDEMWVIARNKDNLEKLSSEVSIPIKAISLDLGEEKSYSVFKELLEKEKPNIKILINASGYGKFEKSTNISFEESIGMIKLNNIALTSLCLLSIPYMKKGANIINIASVAAFQPVPYINIYSATKAYVLNFSRSLNAELKKDGIHVLAVCPFWTKTKFFDRAETKNNVVKKYVVMYEPIDVVNTAWKDLKKGKEISVYGVIAKLQKFLSKLLPHKLIMNIWLKQQKLK